MNRGGRKRGKISRPAVLKINKESRVIRKARMPLPDVQYIQPVIIHIYSPKVHKTDASNFMWLVQSLTGSLRTRLRCKTSKPAASHEDCIPKPSQCIPAQSQCLPAQNQPYGYKQCIPAQSQCLPAQSQCLPAQSQPCGCKQCLPAQSQCKESFSPSIHGTSASSITSEYYVNDLPQFSSECLNLPLSPDIHGTSASSSITSEYYLNDLPQFSSECLNLLLTSSYASKLFDLQTPSLPSMATSDSCACNACKQLKPW